MNNRLLLYTYYWYLTQVHVLVLTVSVVECNLDSLRHELIVIPNHIGRTSIQFNEFVIFGCKDGYETQDDTNLVCQANKTWNGTSPKCTGIEIHPLLLTKRTEIPTASYMCM